MSQAESEGAVAHVVRRKLDAPFRSARARGVERDRDVGGRQRGVVVRAPSEHRDDRAAVRQPTDLVPAVCREHLRADVIYVHRSPEGLAGLSSVPRQKHRLDARVEKMLNRGAGSGAQPVLQPDEAHEPAAERDEDHGAAHRF